MLNEILLADDEVTFRKTFAKILQEEGMTVTAVDNGTDAITAITKRPYAVAILDIQMPGADGIKVLREIMKIRPETRVIMITAYGTVEMAVEAIKLGACDYVMKPVMFDDILAKIRQHIRYLELQEENLQAAVRAYEKEHINRVLNKYEWNKVEAAKALSIGLSSLYRKIDELGINIDKNRSRERAG